MTFTRPQGFVDLPDLKVRCGQCIGCRVGKARSWGLRMCHEDQTTKGDSSFVTLTYDEDCLPEDRSLSVKDWQNFAKRLRKRIGPFRFFHAGEYGTQFSRPHYHAIIFGHDFRDGARMTLDSTTAKPMWLSPELMDVWGKGRVVVEDFNFTTASYVARYCVKKINGARGKEFYENFVVKSTGEVFSVKPEYATMSRRPGLGHDWFMKFKSDVFPSDEVIFQGKRFRPPSYYDKLLSDEERREVMKRRKDGMGVYEDDVSPDRLIQREQCFEARESEYSRDL